jgi:3D (Asp-Asp-Asp) domain-containing protein
MMSTAAAIALLWALATGMNPDVSAVNATAQGPVPYAAIVAAEDAAEARLSAEAAELMDADADWNASIRLYHAGGGGATGNDSLGCRPIPMRTVAVDPRVIPRRTRLFIRETVGMTLPDGTEHDGFWYASDTGGAIRGAKIDLFTGHGRASMSPAMRHNMRTLSVVHAGNFDGCPPDWDQTPSQRASL